MIKLDHVHFFPRLVLGLKVEFLAFLICLIVVKPNSVVFYIEFYDKRVHDAGRASPALPFLLANGGNCDQKSAKSVEIYTVYPYSLRCEHPHGQVFIEFGHNRRFNLGNFRHRSARHSSHLFAPSYLRELFQLRLVCFQKAGSTNLHPCLPISVCKCPNHHAINQASHRL